MTDILNRIDNDIQAWEARPESWLPGDPLYVHPYELDDNDALTVRPMFQLIDDWAPPPRCDPCQVSWAGDVPCWVCGQERPPVFARGSAMALLTRLGRLDDRGVRIDDWGPPPPPPPLFTSLALPVCGNAIRAAVEMEQAMSRAAAVMATTSHAFHEMCKCMPLLPDVRPDHQPRPLRIDGHAYRRRTRNRRSR